MGSEMTGLPMSRISRGPVGDILSAGYLMMHLQTIVVFFLRRVQFEWEKFSFFLFWEN